VSGDIVALKQVKLNAAVAGRMGFPTTALREINVLLMMNHPNIIQVSSAAACVRIIIMRIAYNYARGCACARVVILVLHALFCCVASACANVCARWCSVRAHVVVVVVCVCARCCSVCSGMAQ
jgi:hypothetical protein